MLLLWLFCFAAANGFFYPKFCFPTDLCLLIQRLSSWVYSFEKVIEPSTVMPTLLANSQLLGKEQYHVQIDLPCYCISFSVASFIFFHHYWSLQACYFNINIGILIFSMKSLGYTMAVVRLLVLVVRPPAFMMPGAVFTDTLCSQPCQRFSGLRLLLFLNYHIIIVYISGTYCDHLIYVCNM